MNTVVNNCMTMLRFAIVAVLFSAFTARGEDAATLYTAKCARCHGAEGLGTKKAPQPLTGDRSVAQLAEIIQKTMPEDDPGSLSKDDAQKIAAEIHARFYSDVARARSKPARIDLARLTVRQYRQAVADVIGSFRPVVALNDKQGLNGDYFNRTFQTEMRGTGLSQRLDATVNFDFDTASPLPGKLEHHTYSIQWKGSLIAPETGEYEFVISTPHAGRLYVNDLRAPLIDAWVKSGKDTEFKGRIVLVGGRVYPIQLDYSKGRQGKADNEKKKEDPPPTKSWIKLQWVRPEGSLEAVPAKHLVPVTVPEQYVCTAKFPPDDRSTGWERGTAISKEWDAATTEAALDAAAYVGVKLNALAGTKEGNGDYAKRLKTFAANFAERAFRRPLTDDQKKLLIEKQFEATTDPTLAVKRVILLVLKSPFFLYREVSGGDDSHDTASRLSFGLWDSLPDAELLKAAAAGQLKTREQVMQQAERMLADPRAKAKLRGFLLTWLRADQPHDLAKDAKRFPGFDAATIADLRTSLELFLDDVLASPKADYRELLTSNEIYLNERLAKFYGAPATNAFKRMTLDDGKRAGVLTHPYLMASFASNTESSPIHRGVFLARGILGVSLRPPPEAVAPLAPELHPDLTTRERVILQTKAAACMTCHGVINPLGFTLEQFDAVGKFREKDHGKPIDASGSYKGEDGRNASVNGAKDLAKFLAASPEAHDAFTEQLFHHLVQQPVRAYGATTNDDLRKAFVKNDFNIRKLAVEAMAVSALKSRK